MIVTDVAELVGLFPASAGVIRTAKSSGRSAGSVPRIRGGDPFFAAAEAEDVFCSPHPRG